MFQVLIIFLGFSLFLFFWKISLIFFNDFFIKFHKHELKLCKIFSNTFIKQKIGEKSPTLTKVYDEAKEVIESRTKIIHTIMLRASVPVIVLQFILWSFIQYFTSDFSNDSFRLIYPYLWVWIFSVFKFNYLWLKSFEIYCSVPFNFRSAYGYIAVIPFQLIGIISCSEVCVIVLCLYTGLCLVMTTFVSDIEANLNIMNESLSTTSEFTLRQQIELKICLYETIKFHSDAKE